MEFTPQIIFLIRVKKMCMGPDLKDPVNYCDWVKKWLIKLILLRANKHIQVKI